MDDQWWSSICLISDCLTMSRKKTDSATVIKHDLIHQKGEWMFQLAGLVQNVTAISGQVVWTGRKCQALSVEGKWHRDLSAQREITNKHHHITVYTKALSFQNWIRFWFLFYYSIVVLGISLWKCYENLKWVTDKQWDAEWEGRDVGDRDREGMRTVMKTRK